MEETLEADGTVDIALDLTGGGRDSTVLLALVSQTLSNKEGFYISHVVYTNFSNDKIVDQRDTFRLVELTHAVQAFTAYAQADAICGFFRYEKKSAATEVLCESIRDFSDRLLLCQVDIIADEVTRVIDCLGPCMRR